MSAPGARAYPPGSHAGIVILRLIDQSLSAGGIAVTDLASCSRCELIPMRYDWDTITATGPPLSRPDVIS